MSRCTPALLLALPANRPVVRHVRAVVDPLVQCVRQAVTGKQWPEAQWVGPED